ncbi:hypothetical protein RHS01_04488 [Rhizoctonia solani]|uniref:RNase H type-1 domain-containing protein n=1 Tax=Rhizoctonia solani TaxID=456999 RepID=A0A8H7M2H1_9AGAM|nr:hypothetical protein RHS01_04488 [Rhizoctonia solani]
MIALAEAAAYGVSKARSLDTHNILLFADNKAALSNMSFLSIHPCQYTSWKFCSAIDTFLHESPLNKVELRWVPGHEGVEGNERADALANEGGTKPPYHTHNRSLTWCKAEATWNASRTWAREWPSWAMNAENDSGPTTTPATHAEPPPRQTLDHVIRACPSYDDARLALRNASGSMPDPVLFGTATGLRVVASFINSTDAFKI